MPPSRRRERAVDLPTKANRVLGIILFCFLIVAMRIWNLAVIQHDVKVDQAKRPQTKRLWESAERGTIRDRYHLPMAVNRVQYNAAVYYADIRELPRWTWGLDEEGKKVKRYRRKEHIQALSLLMAKELGLDADRVEDLIYSKAALFQHMPFVLKENISEDSYYRLRMMEKDWPGLAVQKVPQRHYPLGEVGGHILGYMGAINRAEYEGVLGEIRALEAYIEESDRGLNPRLPKGIRTQEAAFSRLQALRDRAYTLNDSIGKSGLEGYYEKDLRGFKGKKLYYRDARGNFLREMPGGREPLSGQQLTLALSSELQTFAEELLIRNEKIREGRSTHKNRETGQMESLRQPWIKGGAIVAMDPNNGDVVALASYPRFDPNDFVPSGDPSLDREKQANIQKWLESELYLGAIWNQQRPVEREVWEESLGVVKEAKLLDWDAFLDFLLPEEHPVREKLKGKLTLRDAVQAQQTWTKLLEIGANSRSSALVNFLYGSSTAHVPYKDKGLSRRERGALEDALMAHENEVEVLRSRLQPYVADLRYNYDKLLLFDLFRLLSGSEGWTEDLLSHVGDQSLSTYRATSAAMTTLRGVVKQMTERRFHDWVFKPWREENQRAFLREKRKEEKLAGVYQKPYLDYLDKEERQQFEDFWALHSWDLLQVLLQGRGPGEVPDTLAPFVEHFHLWFEELSRGAHTQVEWRSQWSSLAQNLKELPREVGRAYLQTMRGFQDLNSPLWGFYPSLKREGGVQLEKHLAMAFYPTYGYGFGRSHAYRQGIAQGSIFKLVTAYTALIQRYQDLMARGEALKKLNPLELIDQVHRVAPGKKQWNMGYFLDGHPIPQQYKGGRIVPSVSKQIGSVDLTRALELSSNPYFAVLASDCVAEPRDLLASAKDFSFGSPTGIDLTGEFGGSLPADLEFNRSGLYEFAIGQHSLVATPLQTAVLLSTVGNGGAVYRPKMVDEIQASVPVRGEDVVYSLADNPYQDYLSLVGVDYPLFVKVMQENTLTQVSEVGADLRRELYFPDEVRGMLLEGMRRAALRSQTRSIYGLYDYYATAPEAPRALQDLKGKVLGKSSTTEARESVDLGLRGGANVYNHIWWGGLFLDDPVSTDRASQMFHVDKDGVNLVVVVYLRYGGYGSEAAPLAAQVAKKWKEILAREGAR